MQLTEFPENPIQLDVCTKITDVQRYTKATIRIIENNNGNPTYLPYLNRLKQFKQILTVKN